MRIGRPDLRLLVRIRGSALLDVGRPGGRGAQGADSKAAPGVTAAASHSLDSVVGVHGAIESPPAGRLAAGHERRPPAPSLREAEVRVADANLANASGCRQHPAGEVGSTGVVTATGR